MRFLLLIFILDISQRATTAFPSENALANIARWQQKYWSQTTTRPSHISCYECYGSLESCTTGRRNLIGGPKIRKCPGNNQCLFRKDPYSNFVALTCSTDCVPTAITFCCSSSLCNCIGPSGCPAALPNSPTPPPRPVIEEEPFEFVTYRTPPTVSRIFSDVESHYDADDRLAAFVETDNVIEETTSPAYHFVHPPMSFVKIAAKSLSLELSPDVTDSSTTAITMTTSTTTTPKTTTLVATVMDDGSPKKTASESWRPRNRVISETNLMMQAPIGNYTGLHCWHCSGSLEECRSDSQSQDGHSLAQVSACTPGESSCTIVEFGDVERTVEMGCESSCTPVNMKHLKISCCETSLCNCLLEGVELGEDCRLLTSGTAVMESGPSEFAHPPIPQNTDSGWTDPTVPWGSLFMTTPEPDDETEEDETEDSSTVTIVATPTTSSTVGNVVEEEDGDDEDKEGENNDNNNDEGEDEDEEEEEGENEDKGEEDKEDNGVEPEKPETTDTEDDGDDDDGEGKHEEKNDDLDSEHEIHKEEGQEPDISMYTIPPTPAYLAPEAEFRSCFYCENCPNVYALTDPKTQAIECPEGRRVACVKAEAIFITLTRIDRYCSDRCPTDTDMVKYHCCNSNLCNLSIINRPGSSLTVLPIFITVFFLSVHIFRQKIH